MPRQSIEDLAEPPAEFRVDLQTDAPDGIIKFETLQTCIDEDQKRRGALEAAIKAKAGNRHGRRRMQQQLRYYDAFLAGKLRRLSAASRVKMREWRLRVSSWLWSLIAALDDEQWVFFSIVLPSWWADSRDLRGVRAKLLMERLRVALYRAGAGNASGWLYAMIDAEFDGNTNGFPMHVHGIATEGMIQVLRKLRKQRQFRRRKGDLARYPHIVVSKKLQIQKPWGNHAELITYASKSMWRQHNSRVEPDGVRRRVGKKHRITGKPRVHMLRWLHRNRVKDQVLLIHLSVFDGALVPGKRGRTGR